MSVMDRINICRLCITSCNGYKSLYDEHGHNSEIYQLMIKHFQTMISNLQQGSHLKVICLNCCSQILDFENFQQSVLQAQHQLVKEPLVLDVKCETMSLSEVNHIAQAPAHVPDNDQEVYIKKETTENNEQNIDTNCFSAISINNEKETFIMLPNVMVELPANNQYYDQDDDYDDLVATFIGRDFRNTTQASSSSAEISQHEKCGITRVKGRIETRNRLQSTIQNESSNINIQTESNGTKITSSNLDTRKKSINSKTNANTGKSKKDLDDLVAQWKPNLECVICNASYTTLTKLQQHFRDQHPSNQFYITCCQVKMKWRFRIEEHIRLHIDPNAYKCHSCDKRYKVRWDLIIHMRRCHPTLDDGSRKSFSPKQYVRRTPKEFDDIMAEWKSDFKCVQCNETCSKYSLLKDHFAEQHPLAAFYIECCSRKLAQPSKIEEHMRFHLDPNAFKCELCPQRHRSKWLLNYHMRNHHLISKQGETCILKGRRKSVTELDDIITQWKPNLECPICNETCKTFALLQQHFRQKHARKECYVLCCQRKFKHRRRFLEHVCLHIDIKPNSNTESHSQRKVTPKRKKYATKA